MIHGREHWWLRGTRSIVLCSGCVLCTHIIYNLYRAQYGSYTVVADGRGVEQLLVIRIFEIIKSKDHKSYIKKKKIMKYNLSYLLIILTVLSVFAVYTYTRIACLSLHIRWTAKSQRHYNLWFIGYFFCILHYTNI